MTIAQVQGYLPPLRPSRGKSQSITTRGNQLTPAASRRRSPRRRFGWLALVALAAIAASVWLALRTGSQPATPARTPPEVATVPKLTMAPGAGEADVLLPGRQLEAQPDDEGCHVLAGRKATLTDFHIVQTDSGDIVTARAPLSCVDGTDYGLLLLLDCARKRRCALISLYSPITHTYYQLPEDSALLIHPRGASREHFPSHIVLRRPARLAEYGGMLP